MSLQQKKLLKKPAVSAGRAGAGGHLQPKSRLRAEGAEQLSIPASAAATAAGRAAQAAGEPRSSGTSGGGAGRGRRGGKQSGGTVPAQPRGLTRCPAHPGLGPATPSLTNYGQGHLKTWPLQHRGC